MISRRENQLWGKLCAWASIGVVCLGGCSQNESADQEIQRPDVSPEVVDAPSGTLLLDDSVIEPMHTEVLAIDLATVALVALAEDIDVLQARQEVRRMQGSYESAVGAAFPAIVPMGLFENVEGSVRATPGNIQNVGFATFQPSIAVQWVVNPGKVIYEIVAAQKRLTASSHRQKAVQIETLRRAAIEFYELVLAQAQVAGTRQSVGEADELLRISRLRAQTGVGIAADELRAQAQLAGRQQDLAEAMNLLYDASLALARTLQLDDVTVTLVPSIEELPPINLVDASIPIEQLLAYAVEFRPDLKGVRSLIEAVSADRGATIWGAWGPQVNVSYQYGGITGNSNNTAGGDGISGLLAINPASATGSFAASPVANALIREGVVRGSRRLDRRRDETFSFSDQQQFTASVSARWSLSAFGKTKAADAAGEQAVLDARQAMTDVAIQVMRTANRSRTQKKLIELASRQTAAAEEALRLTQANMEAGLMTTLDALQAQDVLAQARVRYAAAVVRYNQAEVALLASLGLLDVGAFSP